MEAHISRNCVKPAFENMRFVYNALASPNWHYYVPLKTFRNHCVPSASSDGRYVSLCGIAWVGGFDGPFPALLPGLVHSPRGDDLYDRERGKVHLRRWFRRAGLRAIPDDRRRTPGFAQS